MADKRKRRDKKEAGRRAASARLAAALQRANARVTTSTETAESKGPANHTYRQTTLVLLPDGTQRAVLHLVESSGHVDLMDGDPGEVTTVEGVILQYTDPIDPPFSKHDVETDWNDRWSESENIKNWHDVTSPDEQAMFRDAEVLAFVSV